MKRPRFTLRTLLIAVAVMAGVLACEGARRRSAYYRPIAIAHGRRADRYCGGVAEAEEAIAACEEQAAEYQRSGDATSAAYWEKTARIWSESARYNRKRAAYHTRLQRLYNRAASRPWEPVPPEPPYPPELIGVGAP